MTVDELKPYLVTHWQGIRKRLMNGTYKPSPVRCVELSKPAGGARKLGIPNGDCTVTNSDVCVAKLIRKYLTAGVMVGDITTLTENGTQQSGPLLPLLSNVLRDLLDKELERRGLAFVRYADDGNIYVKSQRAGERVMASITEFIEKKLKLKVNCSKSAVDKLSKRKFLGFTVGSRVKKVLNCWGHRRDLLMKFVGRVMPFNATFQSLRL